LWARIYIYGFLTRRIAILQKEKGGFGVSKKRSLVASVDFANEGGGKEGDGEPEDGESWKEQRGKLFTTSFLRRRGLEKSEAKSRTKGKQCAS